MVYDCFTFLNEYELLDIRLHELKGIVDTFVICESDHTHKGVKKPLNFPSVAHLYRDFDIKYLVYPGIADVSDAWVNERNQRDHLVNGLSGCKSHDVIILSDIDELPNPEVVKSFDEPCICSLEMNLSYYYLNCLFSTMWRHAKIFKYGNIIAGTLSSIRLNESDYLGKVIANAGTHFSYLGGIEKISYKLGAFAHQEFNNEKFNDADLIRKRIEANEDLYGSGNTFVTYPLQHIDYYFPRYVLENLERFRDLIKC
jgi:beta-1,4-mannosyl-glycoprotein beta-1,4-N-acetylglucosaminyltransferase